MGGWEVRLSLWTGTKLFCLGLPIENVLLIVRYTRLLRSKLTQQGCFFFFLTVSEEICFEAGL